MIVKNLTYTPVLNICKKRSSSRFPGSSILSHVVEAPSFVSRDFRQLMNQLINELKLARFFFNFSETAMLFVQTCCYCLEIA